jgi:ATP:ADP antiporter, AAA family
MNAESERGTRASDLVARVIDALGTIRPEERRDTLGAFLTLLGFMMGHALLETARDALFLAELRASLLPWVYLTLAAIALVLTRYHGQLARFFRTGQALNSWLLIAGAVTVTLYVAIFFVGDWIFYVLYAWSGVIATLVVVQFWTMLGYRFTVTQAKRVFAVVGSGSVIGAIAGSGLARVLTAVLPAQHLVLGAGIIFAVSSLAPLMLESAAPGTERPRTVGTPIAGSEIRQIGRLVWQRPYLRRVALMILLATVTFTCVDFVFKSTIARLVPDEGLGELFSSVYLTLNIVSLVVQLLVVGWVLKRVSVSAALAIMPALLLLGAISFIAAAGFVTVLALKAADGSLRYSLYRTTSELLLVPVSAEIRGPVKAFIDVVGQRGGQALGSLLVLLILSATTSEVVVAVFAAVAAGGWLYMTFGLRRHYLDVFRETLSQDVTPTRIEFPALDVASLETLLATLNSSDDRQVIAALDLLAAQDKLRVVPGLILYHPSSTVVLHALELFAAASRVDTLPLIDRLLLDPEPALRAAALRVRTVLLPDEVLLRRGLDDAAAAVRATAAAGLVAVGIGSEAARPELERAVQEREPQTLLALARAVRALPTTRFDELLPALAAADDNHIRLEAVRAMRALKDPSFASILMTLLVHRVLRDEVRRTLVELGPAALTHLGEGLADTHLPHAVRRNVPRAIAAFASPQASTILVRRLLEEPDGMIRFKVLRALGRLRANNPHLPIDHRAIRVSIDQNIASAFRFMRWRHSLERVTSAGRSGLEVHHDALIGLLRDKQTHTVERLFRLLNLYADDDEFARIHRGLHSPKREARAGSRELIENLVDAPLRRPLLTLIDDLYEQTSTGETEVMADMASDETVLGELLTSGIESLSSFAAYLAGRRGLGSLSATLRTVVPLSSSHAGILQDAVERLGATAATGG